MIPHRGYDQGEVPSYGQCPDCGMGLRLDRLDLVEEHNHTVFHLASFYSRINLSTIELRMMDNRGR